MLTKRKAFRILRNEGPHGLLEVVRFCGWGVRWRDLGEGRYAFRRECGDLHGDWCSGGEEEIWNALLDVQKRFVRRVMSALMIETGE